ncbi:RNA polymerase sigma factor [Roseibium salinum]|nr:RNA polymerase sigma factor [Roseibium salinum]
MQAEIPHLRRFAKAMTGSRDAGDDLMQTALERALRSRSQFKDGAVLRPWLFAIVRNAFLDECRKFGRQGRQVSLEDWYEGVSLAPPLRSSVSNWTRSSGRWKKLRPEERTTLQLSAFGGLSHAQIAFQTGVAIGTVKSRRARESLG